MIEAASLSHRRTGCQTLRGLLVSLAGAWICAAQAQSDPGILRRAAELRESPAPTAASLVALPAQASVTRLAGRQGAWIQVRTSAGVTGWVHLFDVGSPGSPTTAPAQGGAPSGSSALRGLTSLLTGGGASGGTTVPTTTVGIRGLSAEDIAQAQPNAEAVTQMEALRQSEAQARAFASGATLVSQTVTPLPSPPAPSNASMAGGVAQ